MKQRRFLAMIALLGALAWSRPRVPTTTAEPGGDGDTPPRAARSTAPRSSSAASRWRRTSRSTSAPCSSISGDTTPRPGQPARRRARHRLPGRDVRRDVGPDARARRRRSRTKTTSARPKVARRARPPSRPTRSIVAVIGTSCSSAALGVADTILSDKGILLFSPSNTNPAPDGGGDAPALLRAHGAQRPDPGRHRGRVRLHGARRQHGRHDRRREPVHAGTGRGFEANFEAGGGTITGSEQINCRTPTSSPLLTIARRRPRRLYFPVFVPRVRADHEAGRGAACRTRPDRVRRLLDSTCSRTRAPPATASSPPSPDLSVFAEDHFYKDEFLPAYEEQFGEPTSVFHAHAFDAMNILFEAIEARSRSTTVTAACRSPGRRCATRCSPRAATTGIIGTITCTELGRLRHRCHDRRLRSTGLARRGRHGRPDPSSPTRRRSTTSSSRRRTATATRGRGRATAPPRPARGRG